VKRLVAAIGAVALAVAFALPVSAKGNPVFAWGPTSNRAIANIVEQQSPDFFYNGGSAGGAYYCTHGIDGATHSDTCAHNLSSCAWNEDDEIVNGSYGVLNAGTTSFTDCLIADNTQVLPATHIQGMHLIGLSLVTDSPDLVVTITYQPQNVAFMFTPRLIGGRYEYSGCIVGPLPDGDQLQAIAGSNGGWGVTGTFTVSTTNQTGHRWQKTQASFYLWDDAPGLPNSNFCRGNLGPTNKQGGATWQTAL